LNTDHNNLSPEGRSDATAATDTVIVSKISKCDGDCRVWFSPT